MKHHKVEPGEYSLPYEVPNNEEVKRALRRFAKKRPIDWSKVHLKNTPALLEIIRDLRAQIETLERKKLK